MRVFTRTFTPSADATLQFRARGHGAPVQVQLYSQRRRTSQGLTVALADGPRELIGEATVDGEDWHTVHCGFNWVRVPTRGYRVYAELRGPEGATLDIDDWELIEWRTPPLQPGVHLDRPASFTHAQRLDGSEPRTVQLIVDAPAARR